MPRRLADQLLTLCGMAVDRKAAALAKADRLALVAATKRLRLPLRGTLGFEKAEVTAGGVSLDEVDSRTMQSKRVAGVYFAGELLELAHVVLVELIHHLLEALLGDLLIVARLLDLIG